eukprot:COSAG02_NODE_44751_length_363_cov_0.893939_1_plen_58_part_10
MPIGGVECRGLVGRGVSWAGGASPVTAGRYQWWRLGGVWAGGGGGVVVRVAVSGCGGG